MAGDLEKAPKALSVVLPPFPGASSSEEIICRASVNLNVISKGHPLR